MSAKLCHMFSSLLCEMSLLTLSPNHPGLSFLLSYLVVLFKAMASYTLSRRSVTYIHSWFLSCQGMRGFCTVSRSSEETVEPFCGHI